MSETTQDGSSASTGGSETETQRAWIRLLGHPRAPWMWVALALLLGLPSIGMGLTADDWLQRMILMGKWPEADGRGVMLELFAFIPSNPARTAYMRELGILAWWSDPEMRGSFLRPVTALTHMFDYRFWPDQIWMQHVHNVVWYCASVGIVAVFFRRFGLALPLAGLAGLMFAVEDAHAMAVSWIANRNASICMVFGVGCLMLHRRWRLEGRPMLGVASVGCFVVSLLAAEAGIGALAYLVAWQWIMEDDDWRARLRGLLPYLVVVVAWRVIYQHMGYGVQWSDVYVDPGRQPLRFLIAMAERLPLLLTAQWLPLPIDVSNMVELPSRILMGAVAWVISLALLRWLWPLIRADRRARFWALGMGFSLVPICASFPMDRVLTFTGLGAFALLAMQVEDWLEGRAPLSGFQRLLLFVNIPFAAVGMLARPHLWFGIMNTFIPPDGLPDDLTRDQTLVMMQTHDLAGPYVSVIPVVKGMVDGPISVAMLGPLLVDVHVHRLDAHTLELRPDGGWRRVPMARLTSSVDRPYTVGDTISMAEFEVEIIEVSEDGRPLAARFVFEQPLEDPRYRWFVFEGTQFTETQPPAVGDRRTLPSPIPRLRFTQ